MEIYKWFKIVGWIKGKKADISYHHSCEGNALEEIENLKILYPKVKDWKVEEYYEACRN